MHTSISDKNPLLSKFFFTYTADTIEDDCLNTYELYNMQLNASLVVLNGCNTGFGQLYSGEGLYNLARAFIHTGCPAIVLTLWNVNDYFGSELISKFYNNLNKGLQKDEALQNAKTNYLANTFFKDDAHPYYWSNYILIGNISPINKKFSTNFYLKILFSIVILSLLVYFFFKYATKNKKN
jgi:CHAT domain-containing protein